MRDLRRGAIESASTSPVPENAVQFCLETLYKDREHYLREEIVEGLTFEELIGALRRVEDAHEASANEIRYHAIRKAANEALASSDRFMASRPDMFPKVR